MLDQIDLKQKLDKETFKKRLPELQDQLRMLARRLYEARIPLIIVFEGLEAAGKGANISRLVDRLDPRGFKVHPIFEPTEEESFHPFLWRFCSRTPGRGEIAIFDRSWYRRVLTDRVENICPKKVWKPAFEEIWQLERELTDDGAVIVKFWLHISKKEQKKRLEKVEVDPYRHWKVSRENWRRHRHYSEFVAAAEEMLERTSSSHAPWTIVEADNRRFAAIKVLETTIETVSRILQAREKAPKPAAAKKTIVARVLTESTVLSRVDLSKKLSEAEYKEELRATQSHLRELEFKMYRRRLPVVVVFEGWDAGGKGGNIKRLTEELDPRGYSVTPISAPTTEEKAHHYLWRFWRHLPKAGHLAIFDRSWYGRVLVERVEGFCSEAEWRRAYSEINEFESQLVSFGTVICKFWLQISQQEQLRRFKEREEVEYKRYKLTDEDWRNREKWPLYEPAVTDMLEKTSTSCAPWTIVEANCKRYARVKTLRTLNEAIEQGLKS